MWMWIVFPHIWWEMLFGHNFCDTNSTPMDNFVISLVKKEKLVEKKWWCWKREWYEITYRCCIFVFKSCVKITFLFFKYKNMNLKKRGNHTLQISENYNSRLMTKIKIFYYNAGGLANFISQVGYYYKKHNS
jgi:hypothetical protein